MNVDVEGVFSGNFETYINSNYVDTYYPLENIPYKFSINGDNFSTGNNTIHFIGNESLYIAGGYVKVVYNESQLLISENKKKFPGIFGAINIYDSFFIPGTLNNLEIFELPFIFKLIFNVEFILPLNTKSSESFNPSLSSSES